MKKFLAFSLSDVLFIMLINVKMPTIVELSMKKVLFTTGPGVWFAMRAASYLSEVAVWCGWYSCTLIQKQIMIRCYILFQGGLSLE